MGDYVVDIQGSDNLSQRYRLAAETVGYGLQAQVSAFEWLLIRGSYGVQEIQYSSFGLVGPTQEFLSANPDYITQSSILLRMQTSF